MIEHQQREWGDKIFIYNNSKKFTAIFWNDSCERDGTGVEQWAWRQQCPFLQQSSGLPGEPRSASPLLVFFIHLFQNRPFTDKWLRFFYGLDALPVTQSTASKHRRKLNQWPRLFPFFIHHQTAEGSVCPLTLALWSQYHHLNTTSFSFCVNGLQWWPNYYGFCQRCRVTSG